MILATHSASGHAPRHNRRDHLITEHVAMATRIARRIARRSPQHLGEDILSAAFVGLTEAAQRFDEARGEAFVAFAAPRIRGAVIDELRRGDILPRRARVVAKQHARVVTRLQHELGRQPEGQEVAAALGVSVTTLRDDIAPSAQVCVVPMALTHAERDTADGGDLASSRLERAQLAGVVRAALSRLPERDAQVLGLYYLEGLSYQEVGEILGVSESRVCQLCTRAVSRLRQLLGDAVEP